MEVSYLDAATVFVYVCSSTWALLAMIGLIVPYLARVILYGTGRNKVKAFLSSFSQISLLLDSVHVPITNRGSGEGTARQH